MPKNQVYEADSQFEQDAFSLVTSRQKLEAVPAEFQLIDTEALARILGLNRRTIEGWIRKRRLPFIRIGKRCVRFRLRDVFRTLDNRYTIKEVRAK
jgi:excisionase family DNA binding protein